MGLNQTMDLIGHLDLSGMWAGVDLRMGTQKACVYKSLNYILKETRLCVNSKGGGVDWPQVDT